MATLNSIFTSWKHLALFLLIPGYLCGQNTFVASDLSSRLGRSISLHEDLQTSLEEFYDADSYVEILWQNNRYQDFSLYTDYGDRPGDLSHGYSNIIMGGKYWNLAFSGFHYGVYLKDIPMDTPEDDPYGSFYTEDYIGSQTYDDLWQLRLGRLDYWYGTLGVFRHEVRQEYHGQIQDASKNNHELLFGVGRGGIGYLQLAWDYDKNQFYYGAMGTQLQDFLTLPSWIVPGKIQLKWLTLGAEENLNLKNFVLDASLEYKSPRFQYIRWSLLAGLEIFSWSLADKYRTPLRSFAMGTKVKLDLISKDIVDLDKNYLAAFIVGYITSIFNPELLWEYSGFYDESLSRFGVGNWEEGYRYGLRLENTWFPKNGWYLYWSKNHHSVLEQLVESRGHSRWQFGLFFGF